MNSSSFLVIISSTLLNSCKARQMIAPWSISDKLWTVEVLPLLFTPFIRSWFESNRTSGNMMMTHVPTRIHTVECNIDAFLCPGSRSVGHKLVWWQHFLNFVLQVSKAISPFIHKMTHITTLFLQNLCQECLSHSYQIRLLLVSKSFGTLLWKKGLEYGHLHIFQLHSTDNIPVYLQHNEGNLPRLRTCCGSGADRDSDERNFGAATIAAGVGVVREKYRKLPVCFFDFFETHGKLSMQRRQLLTPYLMRSWKLDVHLQLDVK